jgi:hypothetical protein
MACMLKRLILGIVALSFFCLAGLGCSKDKSDATVKDKTPAVQKKGGGEAVGKDKPEMKAD